MSSRKSRIAFIDTSGYITDCNLSALSPQHAMKPYRVLATNELCCVLHIDEHCKVITPPLVSVDDINAYHCATYLCNLGLHNISSWTWNTETSKAVFSSDCPPVEGIMEHSIATASGTLMGAVLLNSQLVDISIHWGGGMHHAKCGECCGFCYINDIVLAILELLKCHERVLYIDLDVHHGDGVDEAFCQSNRVYTLSLHKFGESFFPGTGHPRDVGFGSGRYYTMNLALWDGISDFFYTTIFSYALRSVVSVFNPDVIVLQCGADSLAGDRLGVFNLSSEGHGQCVSAVHALHKPLLVVGGGGYTIRNVAKLWAYETSLLCGHSVPLHTTLPVQHMPLTGWLFENSPTLLVPRDSSNRTLPGLHAQRALRACLEQIDRRVAFVAPHPNNIIKAHVYKTECKDENLSNLPKCSVEVKIEREQDEHDDAVYDMKADNEDNSSNSMELEIEELGEKNSDSEIDYNLSR